MLKLSKKSKHSAEEVIKRAEKFFGTGGYGLKVTEKDDCCITFEGGGGGVYVTTAAEKKGTTVDVESREWDFQTEEFMGKI